VLAACLAAGLASTRAALVPEALFPALGYLAAFLCGTVAVPLLLPWLPGRSFSLKGALAGLVPVVGIGCLSGGSAAAVLPALLALPAVSAFFALNFTGATPYTSRSGVKKELRLSLPWMGLSALAGVAAWIAGKWPG
jgi:acetyl-CoA decarbonylase/synthase complex subunit gamma